MISPPPLATMQVSLPYVHEYRDRHGRLRRYFRRGRRPRIALPGEPGSADFVAAYNAALAGFVVRPPIGVERSQPGTVAAAIAAYYTDQRFLVLAPSSRQMRRAILERFRESHGDKRIGTLHQARIVRMLGTMRPFAARNWLKTLRGLLQFAVAIGLRPDDPSAGIELAKAREGHRHTWSEEEIARFERCHPVGSRPRLAMALLLYTGQRRADVVRMGPQHVAGGLLAVRQQKTRTMLQIPLHPSLAAILVASATGNLAFLVTAAGAPFTAAGFGNAMRQWCDEAGLPECTAHGLRRGQCRRLAEAGCTAPQIAAISGHKSLREVQRYIEDANQVTLARAAIGRLVAAERKQNKNRRVANLPDQSG